MGETSKIQVATIGLAIAKHVAQAHGVDFERLLHRRIRLIAVSLPGLTRQSMLEPAPGLGMDARVILGFQTKHCAPNGNPRTGMAKKGTFRLRQSASHGTAGGVHGWTMPDAARDRWRQR
jgi:hypothetical protein